MLCLALQRVRTAFILTPNPRIIRVCCACLPLATTTAGRIYWALRHTSAVRLHRRLHQTSVPVAPAVSCMRDSAWCPLHTPAGCVSRATATQYVIQDTATHSRLLTHAQMWLYVLQPSHLPVHACACAAICVCAPGQAGLNEKEVSDLMDNAFGMMVAIKRTHLLNPARLHPLSQHPPHRLVTPRSLPPFRFLPHAHAVNAFEHRTTPIGPSFYTTTAHASWVVAAALP